MADENQNAGQAGQAGQSNSNNDNNAGNSGSSGADNNQKITQPLHSGLWDNKPTGNEQQQQDNSQQFQQAQQQPVQKSPDEIMQEHIAGLNLTSNVNIENLTESLNNGDTKPLLSALETAAANAYKASVENISKLMDSKISAAVEKATEQATGNINSNLAVQELHNTLKFTEAPDVAPIAEAIMTKLINDGKSVSDAIKGTNNFFKSVTEVGIDHYDSISQQRPGSQNQQGRQNNSADDEHWASLLKGL